MNHKGGKHMKKIASWLLCLVLLLALFPVNVSAAEDPCMEATAAMSEDGIVTVVVLAAQPAANARLHVTFDSACLSYVGYETVFAAHSVQAGEEKLTIGLANASANPVKSGEELVKLTFAVDGSA